MILLKKNEMSAYQIVEIGTGNVVMSGLSQDDADAEIGDFYFQAYKCGIDDAKCPYKVVFDKDLADMLYSEHLKMYEKSVQRRKRHRLNKVNKKLTSIINTVPKTINKKMNIVLYAEMDKKEKQITFYSLSESGDLYNTALDALKTLREAANELNGSYMDAESTLHLNVSLMKAYRWIIRHVDRSIITFNQETATEIYVSRCKHRDDINKKRPYNKN